METTWTLLPPQLSVIVNFIFHSDGFRGIIFFNIVEGIHRCILSSRAYCPSFKYVHSSLVSYRIVQLICLEPPPGYSSVRLSHKMSILAMCLSSLLKDSEKYLIVFFTLHPSAATPLP